MTLRRASEIQHGEGPPPTAAEREEFEKHGARLIAAGATLTNAFPQLQAAAKAFPAAMRVINAAPKAERERLENLPIVVVARMGHPHRSRPRRDGTSPRSRSSRSRQRARSPGRKSEDDPPQLAELIAVGAELAALIAELGPCSACWLATTVGRRKETVLKALRLGSFVMLGRGRAARWDVAPTPAEIVDFRDAVWKARRSGAIEAYEAIELLLEPPPRVLAILAEAAA